MSEPSEQEYAALFETFQFDETVLAADAGETIKLAPDDVAATIESLPTFHVSVDDDGAAAGGELKIGRTLGEGGMGIVRAAMQAPFEREVALKTVRSAHVQNDQAIGALLREAIVTGRLEHPNIVPIYSVGQDYDGLPVIVMKRIDGRSWRELLDDSEEVDGDRLESSLSIFGQVCAAVHYAHRHGVLHRDIKPENVMVGEHEDVYLVDWGLAVSLEDRTRRLPWVGDVDQVAGTPMYMAPEMALAGKEPLGVFTDVYLLGAVLHELVTGTPRHDGDGLYPIMLSAYQSAPVEYGPDVPAELAAICNRATHRDPSMRYESALDLRDAVREFSNHRSAARLADEAFVQLEELERVLDDGLGEEERRVAVYRSYGAARFGFERSVAEWPEQTDAYEGLQRTLEQMAEWELGHGSPHAAAALVADLPTPSPELARRVEEVERAQEQTRRELEDLRERERHQDLTRGARARGFLATLMVVGCLLVPGFFVWLGLFDPLASRLGFWLISVALAVSVSLVCVVVWYRDLGPFELERTEANLRILQAMAVLSLFLPAFRGLGMLGELSIPMQFTLELAVFTSYCGIFAVLVERKIAVAAIPYAIATVVAFALPSAAITAYTVGGALGLGWIAWLWSTQHVERSGRASAPAHDEGTP